MFMPRWSLASELTLTAVKLKLTLAGESDASVNPNSTLRAVGERSLKRTLHV